MDVRALIAMMEAATPPGFASVTGNSCAFCTNYHHSYSRCDKYTVEFKNESSSWLQFHYNCNDFKLPTPDQESEEEDG